MLLENDDDCEVDPTKMQAGANLQHNKDALVRLVKKAWLDILSSYTKFPRSGVCGTRGVGSGGGEMSIIALA